MNIYKEKNTQICLQTLNRKKFLYRFKSMPHMLDRIVSLQVKCCISISLIYGQCDRDFDGNQFKRFRYFRIYTTKISTKKENYFTLTSIFVRPTSRTNGITRNGNDISFVVR